MKLEKNLICTGIDDNYMWPWMVSIYSAKANSSEDFRILVGFIKDSLSDKNITLIRGFCEVLEIEVGFQEFEFNYEVKTTNLPVQAYIRLLWLDLLDENFLWLDSDTLLLANWQSIFHQKSSRENWIIKAVKDPTSLEIVNEAFENQAFKKGKELYFNSGIFIANPKKWREYGFDNKWPLVAASHKKLGFYFHDQDVLNYLLFAKQSLLDPSFNSFVAVKSSLDAKILHFIGKRKPWHFDDQAKKYFMAIEILKNEGSSGAFGGINWLLECQIYWRYEESLLEAIKEDSSLSREMQVLQCGARSPQMANKDRIKFRILRIAGRKWL